MPLQLARDFDMAANQNSALARLLARGLVVPGTLVREVKTVTARKPAQPLKAEFVAPTKRLNGAEVANCAVILERDNTRIPGQLTMRLTVGKRTGLVIFSPEQARQLAAMLNGGNHEA